MTTRDDIQQALHDAIGWQEGLANAWSIGSSERQEALDQIKAYRRILKRRYGEDRAALDIRLADAKLVDVFELRATKICDCVTGEADPQPCRCGK